jgi:hypothetical protein
MAHSGKKTGFRIISVAPGQGATCTVRYRAKSVKIRTSCVCYIMDSTRRVGIHAEVTELMKIFESGPNVKVHKPLVMTEAPVSLPFLWWGSSLETAYFSEGLNDFSQESSR